MKVIKTEIRFKTGFQQPKTGFPKNPVLTSLVQTLLWSIIGAWLLLILHFHDLQLQPKPVSDSKWWSNLRWSPYETCPFEVRCYFFRNASSAVQSADARWLPWTVRIYGILSGGDWLLHHVGYKLWPLERYTEPGRWSNCVGEQLLGL